MDGVCLVVTSKQNGLCRHHNDAHKCTSENVSPPRQLLGLQARIPHSSSHGAGECGWHMPLAEHENHPDVEREQHPTRARRHWSLARNHVYNRDMPRSGLLSATFLVSEMLAHKLWGPIKRNILVGKGVQRTGSTREMGNKLPVTGS